MPSTVGRRDRKWTKRRVSTGVVDDDDDLVYRRISGKQVEIIRSMFSAMAVVTMRTKVINISANTNGPFWRRRKCSFKKRIRQKKFGHMKCLRTKATFWLKNKLHVKKGLNCLCFINHFGHMDLSMFYGRKPP